MRYSDLTPEQLECVEFDKHQHLLIKGQPGSGKTWVLLFRGAHLAPQRQHGEHDVPLWDPRHARFVTFTNSLTKYALDLKASAAGGSLDIGELDGQRSSLTCHQLCWRLMRELGIHPQVIEGKRRDNAILRSIDAVRRDIISKTSPKVLENPLDWWLDEFRWIKGTLLPDGRLITSFEDYRGAERKGRGSALQASSRELVWRVYQLYHDGVSPEIDFDDYARNVVARCMELSGIHDPRQLVMPRALQEFCVDHLLIDESQDLTQVQILLLSKLARKTITVVADTAQNIYRTPFTYQSVGLSISSGNRNVKSLTLGFRTTRQIYALAYPLWDASERPPYQEIGRDGPVPVLHIAANPDEEEGLVIRLIREELQRDPESTLGVLVRARRDVYRLSELLRDSNVASEELERRKGSVLIPGVKLTTYHTAKGLEFDVVILTHLADGELPLNPKEYHGEMAQLDEEEFLASERRLLYVGMTRARHTLHMTCTEPRSRFLREPYATAYETVGPAVPATVPADDLDEMISLDDFDDLPL